ncbi:MAG: ABC transporter permease, partial [Anaerolineales bacterium]|nr:ABC transporter permease [Anaerolineales bacterium]
LLAELQQELPSPYAAPPFNLIPGRPDALELHLRFHAPHQHDTIARLNFDAKVLTAQGDYHLVHLLPGEVPEEPDWVTFTGPAPVLPAAAYPLQLVSLWVRTGDTAWLIPPEALAIDDLLAIEGADRQRITGFEPGDGERWQPLDVTLFMGASNLFVRSGRSGLEFSFGYQLTAVGYWYGFMRWGSNNAGALPALVTPRFLEATGLSVGDTVATRISSGATSGWRPIRLRIAGVMDAFPTLGDLEPAGSVIVWQTPLLARLNAEIHSTVQPNELWLDTPPTSEQIAAADEVLAIEPILQELRAQPMAVGLRTVTSLGFWMAIIFCVAGIGSYLYLTLRQNEAQYAVLRALGMSERQLYAALSLEQVILIVTGLAFGTGVGWLLSQLLL